MVTLLVFELKIFDLKYLFSRDTLTTFLVIFELKCYCLSKSKEIGRPRLVKTG